MTAVAARRPRAGSAPGTRITSSRSARSAAPSFGPLPPWRDQPDSASAASAPRSIARAPRSARVSTRARQSPSSGPCGRARTITAVAPSPRSQPSSAARATMFSLSVMRRASRSWMKSPTAALAGPLGRARALQLEPDQVPHEAQQRRRRLLAARPVAKAADLGVGHAQLGRLRAGLAGHHRALVLRRRARHREHAAARVEHDHARVERPARRPRHGGQAAPDSTASETSSRASRKWARPAWASRVLCRRSRRPRARSRRRSRSACRARTA